MKRLNRLEAGRGQRASRLASQSGADGGDNRVRNRAGRIDFASNGGKGGSLQERKENGRGDGVATVLLVFQGPLFLGRFEQSQVVCDGVQLSGFTRPNEVGNRDRRQQT